MRLIILLFSSLALVSCSTTPTLETRVENQIRIACKAFDNPREPLVYFNAFSKLARLDPAYQYLADSAYILFRASELSPEERSRLTYKEVTRLADEVYGPATTKLWSFCGFEE